MPLEEPPPYTPRPAPDSGETTVEHGPRRPFQPPPPRGSTPQRNWSAVQNHVMHTGSSSASLGSSPSLSNSRSGSLFQQLTNSLNQVVQNLNNSVVAPQWTGQSSSYPGQQRGSPQSQPYHPPPPHPPPSTGPPSMDGSTGSRFEPPPRHPQSSAASTAPSHPPFSPPTSSANMRRHSSEFARDFYAAGAEYVPQDAYDPPTGPPPPPKPMATGTRRASISNDGRPTTTPSLGHPLLKDGKLLVFPKGYECEKCTSFY